MFDNRDWLFVRFAHRVSHSSHDSFIPIHTPIPRPFLSFQAALFDGELPSDAEADAAADSVLRDASSGRRLAVTEAERTLVHVKRTLSSKLIALQVRLCGGYGSGRVGR